eukprot:CAMPEP_0183367728 /NCGR_PEP_ID=MMETSP0164_2-20130417/93448_1 /TAXON_ID=221442 /ORGANISM="Coccolithus pelagicus ssp braarudi, Strain PLY182g" /LENGTH=48 /DNA_ID= /DNA_START= /DNA_END= /DNA_ORIENTATION=
MREKLHRREGPATKHRNGREYAATTYEHERRRERHDDREECGTIAPGA